MRAVVEHAAVAAWWQQWSPPPIVLTFRVVREKGPLKQDSATTEIKWSKH